MKSADERVKPGILEPGSGGEIVRLHRACFPEQDWRYTIFASPRVDRFVETQLGQPDHRFVGVYRDESLIAYEHIRRIKDRLHLNYIAVLPSLGGRGTGASLLRQLFVQATTDRYPTVSLDVSEDNQVAVDWYLRNGFSIESATDVFIVSRGVRAPQPNSYSCHWSDEQRERERMYGISEFEVAREQGSVMVGVIGNSLYRIIGVDDPMLIDSLLGVDPTREVLVMLPAGTEPSFHASLHGRTLRMSRRL